jgi:hypothetical protein
MIIQQQKLNNNNNNNNYNNNNNNNSFAGKRPLGRYRRRWEENIITGLTGKAWTGFIWLS